VIFTSGQDDLVVQYGSPGGEATMADVEHAQRVAEGVGLEIHRNTWRYNKLIEHQRRIVAAHRDSLLHGAEPDEPFLAECADRHAELVEAIGLPAVRQGARTVSLYTVDRAWADHLAFLGDLREGIHLRALGRQDPLDEFHRAAISAFGRLLEDARARAVELFRSAPVTAGRLDVAAVGVHRPTATWTYLVHENPAGTEIERALQSVSGMLRRKR
jgi:preprotein translocase subunit SecA